ncbi:hypothetical protein BGX38DRAFT_1201391 [Terfezia claveryi]|nr:hypothetical protein BGX38DRAFT_1201391 [Terfezia claveryi]
MVCIVLFNVYLPACSYLWVVGFTLFFGFNILSVIIIGLLLWRPPLPLNQCEALYVVEIVYPLYDCR